MLLCSSLYYNHALPITYSLFRELVSLTWQMNPSIGDAQRQSTLNKCFDIKKPTYEVSGKKKVSQKKLSMKKKTTKDKKKEENRKSWIKKQAEND